MKKILKPFVWIWQKIRGFCSWYIRLYRGRAWYVKLPVALVSCLVALLLYLGAVDINLFGLFGKSPGIWSGLRDATTAEASEIYSADGKQIGKFFSENRTPVTYEQVNPVFFDALIATEDVRFYKHYGVDPIGIASAVKDALVHHDGRGASTITQQLAKNMFRVRSNYSTGLLGKIPGLKIMVVKSNEWIIAFKLEMMYTKKEILTMYANTVDFGSNAFGIKTAAKTYFDVEPKDLTTEQACVLVGMLKATTYYNPKLNPKNSTARRNTVLDNLCDNGKLSRQDCDSLKQIPIELKYKVEENYDGQAMYFRQAVADNLSFWCEENGYDLYTSGLKIYTTIDTRMQEYAEDAARRQMKQVQQNFNNHWGIYRKQQTGWMKQEPWRDEKGQVMPDFIDGIARRQPFYKNLQARFPNQPDSVRYYYKEWVHPVKVFDYDEGEVTREMTSEDSIKYMVSFMHCAMVAMEPQTGHVKAWVGDIDFKTWKYDKVTAERQPGSTFKLFVYTEAMNQGLTPCDKRRDEYISMQVYDRKKNETTTWTPHNANGTFSGDSMPLKSAFARSINTVAVRLGQEVGIRRIIETAEKMGIESPLDDAPSLALGSSDVTLLELTNAYCTVAANGMHHKPVLVTRIEKGGKVIYEDRQDGTQAIEVRSAYLMQQLLMSGMREPGGTSQSLWGYVGNVRDTDFGGKTGTSNNHSDAWFECVSPNLVVGAWVGGEYRSIHFRTGALGQGSRTALPITGLFIQAVMENPEFKQYHGKWSMPSGANITRDMYECASYYQRAVADTDSVALQEYDEFGNPIERKKTPEEVISGISVEDLAPVKQGQPAKEKATHNNKQEGNTRKETVITLDDL